LILLLCKSLHIRCPIYVLAGGGIRNDYTSINPMLAGVFQKAGA